MTQAPSTNNSEDTTGDTSSSALEENTGRAPLHTSCAPSAPQVPSEREREAKLKAEARAYALSGTTNEGKNYKRKQLSPPAAVATIGNPATTIQHATKKVSKRTAATTIANTTNANPKPNANTTTTPHLVVNPHKRPRTAMTGAVSKTATSKTATSKTATSSIPKPTIAPTPKTTPALEKTNSLGAPPKHIPPQRPSQTKTKAAGGRKAPKATRPCTTKASFVGGPLSATKSAATAIVSNATTPSATPLKDYDPEYLKLIQSLGELDDFSIWDNLDNVEDEEFRLSDLDDDEMDIDDDEDDDEDDDDDDDDEEVVAAFNAAKDDTNDIAAAAPVTVPSTPAEKDASNQLQPIQTPVLASPSLHLPGWDDDREDGGVFYKDLEEELGSLLEEELEAAVRSLYTTKGSSASSNEDGKKKKGGTKKASTKKQQQQQQQQQQLQLQQQQQQLPQALTPSAFVATTVGTGGGSMTPVTAATLAAEAKRKEREANSAAGKPGTAQPGTPLRETARNSATVTYQQSQQLRTLMKKHYQLLAQQAILSVRAAHALKSGNGKDLSSLSSPPPSRGNKAAAGTPNDDKGWGGGDFQCGENETDLTEILDLAVGMLQDLDQNRKDAIRTSIQLAMSSSGGGTKSSASKSGTMEAANRGSGAINQGKTMGGKPTASEPNGTNTNPQQQQPPQHPGARRSLLSQFSEDSQSSSTAKAATTMVASQSTPPSNQGGRLTRAAFRKLQAQPIVGSKRTAFDIPGLLKLDETFATIDDSVNIGPHHHHHHPPGNKPNNGNNNPKKVNILQASTHAHACRDVLKDAGANVEEALLPGVLDVSENFSQLEEHLGDNFSPPCSLEQEQFLRKNRNLFTSGEDNLVLRGVNLYGEKQWILIGDRYLPDRSVNIISQRYSKLCVMLYKAHGIHIDAMGNLLEPPKHESVDDINEDKVKAVGLKLVEPPAILNVHRWSMEEDLTILKAVPIMGHMWAELGARLIPHRDRGHLRKRYQVLERRVKATITRGKKERARNDTKRGTTKAKTKTPTKATKGTKAKATASKTSTASSTAAKARASPGRKEKKLSSPAGSAPKTKATSKTTSASKRKGTTGKATTNLEVSTKRASPTNSSTTETTSTSPMMSLEKGAALLACLKPKETQSNRGAANRGLQTTATKAIPIRPAPAVTIPKAGTKTMIVGDKKNRKPVYPKPKTKPPHPDAKGTGRPPNMPSGDQRHPYYPYVYDRYHGRYYIPGYQYHGHPPPPPNENDKNHPAFDYHPQNLPPPHPPNHSQSYPPERKPILPLASPKPNMVARPKDLDTPNSKSFLGNFSKLVGDEFSALGADGETSRQALEKMMEFVGNDDGLQLSRMQKMMENKDESEAAKAIVTQLAKSPGRGGEFSNLLDSNSNMTGLSLLNEVSKPDESGLSIMARVLGSSSSSAKGESTSIIPGSMPSPLKKSSTAPKSNSGTSSSSIVQTPTKLKAESFFRNSTSMDPPETPKAGTSMFGTPLGLSPGLRTLRASALLKDDGAANHSNLAPPFSPAPSALLKTEGLATNLTFPYSLGPNLSRSQFGDVDDDDKNLHHPVAETDRFDFEDSRVCEDSNQLGDLAVGAQLTDADATPNGNSLSIAQEEFDAISGLGALSNSPFKTVKSKQRGDGETKQDDEKPQSFFRRVFGNSKETSPQKKLF